MDEWIPIRSIILSAKSLFCQFSKAHYTEGPNTADMD